MGVDTQPMQSIQYISRFASDMKNCDVSTIVYVLHGYGQETADCASFEGEKKGK